MDITELSPELQELVRENQILQGNDGTFKGSVSNSKKYGNFNWDETPQGEKFWNDIDQGRDIVARESVHYPHSRTVNAFKFF